MIPSKGVNNRVCPTDRALTPGRSSLKRAAFTHVVWELPPLQQAAVTTTENGIYSETTTIIPTSKLKPTTGNFCISNEKSVSRATVCFTIKTMHRTVLYVLLILLWKDWHFSQTTRLTRSVAGFIKSSINAYKNTFCLPQPKL